VDRIITALPKVVERHPNTQLLVVGDGAEREELEELARSLGVDPDVRFAGAVAQSEIPKFLWASDIFVSMHDVSNISSSLLQAMSVGLPIITLDTGGTRDFVRDRYNGMLLDSAGLPDCLHQAVIELLENAKLREFLSQNATAFAKEHFRAWEDRIEKEVKEIERVASQSLSEGRAE
jgi:glycosyltransferase involved in cell wall biosynthesis